MTASATSSGLAVVPIGERVLRKSLGVPVLHCRVHNAGSNRIEADFPFCVLAREANRNASRPPLVSIGIDAEIHAIGFLANAAVMVVTLLPMSWASICFTASWVTKMNPSKFVETKRRKSSAPILTNYGALLQEHES